MKVKPSKNLALMIKRKELVREGSPESERKAERLLEIVERNGGLTTEEVMTLTAF